MQQHLCKFAYLFFATGNKHCVVTSSIAAYRTPLPFEPQTSGPMGLIDSATKGPQKLNSAMLTMLCNFCL